MEATIIIPMLGHSISTTTMAIATVTTVLCVPCNMAYKYQIYVFKDKYRVSMPYKVDSLLRRNPKGK